MAIETALMVAIIGKCLVSFDRPDLLLTENVSEQIIDQIYQKFNISVYSVSKNMRLGNEALCSLNNFEQQYSCMGTVPTVIIDAPNHEGLESTLSHLKNEAYRRWRARASYYFVILPSDSCDDEKANEALKLMWKYWVLNGVVICHENEMEARNITSLKLYTFDPYTNKHPSSWRTILEEEVDVSLFIRNFSHPWYIFGRNYSETESFERCGDLFFDKTRDIGHYVIPMSVIENLPPWVIANASKSGVSRWSGEDGMILNLLAKKLRFNMIQVPPDRSDAFGFNLPNGSFTGSLGDVMSGRSNLAVNSRYLMLPFQGYATAYPHGDGAICFISRAGKNRPQWTNLLTAWDPWLVTTFFAMIIFLGIYFYMLDRRRGLLWGYLNSQRMILGSSISIPSRSVKTRSVVGSAFLVILVLNGVFQGLLVSLLTIPRPYPNLDTLQQLKDQKITIQGHIMFKAFLEDPEIMSLFRVSRANECIERLVVEDRQKACIVDCHYADVVNLKSKQKLHKGTQRIRDYHLAHMTTPNWPLHDRFDLEVQKSVESGLRMKWRHDVLRDVQVSTWAQKRATASSDKKKLEYRELLLAFMILYVGLAIALIAFIAEVALASLRKTSNQHILLN